MLIPFQQKTLAKAVSDQKQESFSLTSVRLKEIVPLYQDVTIRCAVSRYLSEAPAIHSAQDVVDLFGFLQFEARENFFALHLNAKNQILCLDQVSVGSLTASIVHPREVYKSALLSSAAAVVFVHNHPSGDPTPSREDHVIHQRLLEAGELLGIRVLDHLIIGSGGHHVSLATAGTTANGEDLCCDEDNPLFV